MHQALLIYIEFNDHNEQTHTYYNLGTIALLQHQFEHARTAFYKALEILVENENNESIPIVLNALARIWEVTRETSLLLKVASILKDTPEGVETLFCKILETKPTEREEEP